MPAVFEFEHQVSAGEIDELGHVNNLAYLRWMQDAAIAHSAAQGWPTERYLTLGAGWVVRSHYVEYLRPAFLGDHIIVLTWVSNLKRISSLRKYKITCGESRVLAVAETNWAFVGFEQHLPRRVPAEVADSFAVVPQEQEP